MKETAEEVGDMEEQVAEEVRKGDLEAAQDLGEVGLLPEGQLGPADDFDGHWLLATQVWISLLMVKDDQGVFMDGQVTGITYFQQCRRSGKCLHSIVLHEFVAQSRVVPGQRPSATSLDPSLHPDYFGVVDILRGGLRVDL